ncbi:MAG: hypothetical protein IJM35_08955 [Bacteroidales bacterium]|nr:hypothetical protein [Bacteroidales bacterium]
MNIEKKQIDALDLELTVTVSGSDYLEAEKKKLNDYRRKAELRGFRKGMAPMSLIQRLYGGQVLYETVNGVLSEALNGYINDNNLRIVGEPLPSADQPELEWKSGNDFVFKFDIATTPEVNFTVDKDDKLPYYQINVTEKAKAEMKASLLRQWGNLEEGKAAKEDDYIIADLDNGEHKVEGAYISLRSVSEAVRPLFIGLASGQTVEIDVNKTFENETDRAAMLKVKKEELSSLNPEFKLNVVNVKTFVPASENQETYDRIFGKDVVKTPEEFEAKIAERVRDNYTQEADARLSRDIREYFMKKADIALPEAFLKRWLISVNEGKYTPEQVEAEFGSFLTDFRWQMTRGHILRKFDLKVEDKDLHEAALSFAAYQYAMYGMGNVPQDMIEDAARRMLDDENQVRRLEEQVEDRKAIEAVRANVTLQNKKISEEKFRAL